MKLQCKSITFLSIIFLLLVIVIYPVQAGTVTVTGNIQYTTRDGETGTTYDRWNINMLDSGRFTVNVLAFESTDNTPEKAVDINGDGELTYLDPDTYFYKNTGSPLLATDLLARCDDINNNCDTIDTPTIKLSSLSEAEGATDGSIHFRRDPAFNVELAAGEYLYLMADYRLSPEDAEAGFDFGNSIRNTEVGGHADYQIIFSSNTMNFDVSGKTINISAASVAAVPAPTAIWLLGAGLVGLIVVRRKGLPN